MDKDNVNAKFLTTSDKWMAASLCASGIDITRLDKTDRKRVKFYFRYTSDLEIKVGKYHRGELKVSPQELRMALDQIETKIHTDIQ